MISQKINLNNIIYYFKIIDLGFISNQDLKRIVQMRSANWHSSDSNYIKGGNPTRKVEFLAYSLVFITITAASFLFLFYCQCFKFNQFFGKYY